MGHPSILGRVRCGRRAGWFPHLKVEMWGTRPLWGGLDVTLANGGLLFPTSQNRDVGHPSILGRVGCGVPVPLVTRSFWEGQARDAWTCALSPGIMPP
jgi:hypothetical protein